MVSLYIIIDGRLPPLSIVIPLFPLFLPIKALLSDGAVPYYQETRSYLIT